MTPQGERESPGLWQPTTFVRFEAGLDTSMGTAQILTDRGSAYIKAMGNPQGPHPLACELVATRLAKWFGLPTFDIAILEINADVDEIPFRRGGQATSGPAFVARAVTGHTWGGATEELSDLVNKGDVGRLVVFDTWLSNCDRHPPDLNVRRPNYDNVFLEDLTGDEAGKTRLIAMDHTHCLTCGRDLDGKMARIDRAKDSRLYGLFQGFKPFVRQSDVETAIHRLRQLEEETVRSIVSAIPSEWEVDSRAKDAIVQFIMQRSQFVAETVLKSIAKECWPGRLFDCG